MASIKKEQILESIEFCEKNGYFEKLNDIYSTLPKGDCAGCGNCCMESVGINLIEFLNIYRYLAEKQELRECSIERIVDYYFMELMKKNSCPFRDENNGCLIYEVRPLNCRLFGHWKKEDYNKNLSNVTQRNREYRDLIKSKYGFDISDKVVNYKIEYCESFIPQERYLEKSERLEFADNLMILDSNIYSKGIIDIDFKDRGIVEYFIESLLKEDTAYNIKVRVSKDKNVRNRAINRLKKILL